MWGLEGMQLEHLTHIDKGIFYSRECPALLVKLSENSGDKGSDAV